MYWSSCRNVAREPGQSALAAGKTMNPSVAGKFSFSVVFAAFPLFVFIVAALFSSPSIGSYNVKTGAFGARGNHLGFACASHT